MADTFGVGIQLTETEFRVVVHVPSDIDSGWTDPEAFQQLVAEAVWDRLEKESVLRTVAEAAESGETVSLGTVTLDPDGSVVASDLSPPEPSDAE
ncbi:hypothetical protein [Haloparvum sedimenti]|uniref:hypothetical protein n=1 Tax=Haloparvum sedimenti TaxID=1678448 RepID=UPI00071E7A01|nr:hypothetical protein [Haloparvum sedimenti]